MPQSLKSIVRDPFYPLLQILWGGALVFAVSIPTNVWAGNMLEQSIELVNQDRVEAGLAPLTENALLRAAAEAKANDMLKNDYFAHTSPKGDNPWYWLKLEGYNYRAAGENLAINYEDAKELHKAWMKSPTHRANILNRHFEEIGMATLHGRLNGKNATITVQLFGTPRSARAAKTPQPMQETPSPSVQGMQTETTTKVMVEIPSVPRMVQPPVTVLINPTLFEKMIHSHFVADHVWFIWAEYFITVVFFALALALPIVFLVVMQRMVRLTLHARHQ